jgi:hypothetical protein
MIRIFAAPEAENSLSRKITQQPCKQKSFIKLTYNSKDSIGTPLVQKETAPSS